MPPLIPKKWSTLPLQSFFYHPKTHLLLLSYKTLITSWLINKFSNLNKRLLKILDPMYEFWYNASKELAEIYEECHIEKITSP